MVNAKTLLNRAKKQKQSFEPKTPIATDMFLPNQSGDHSAGNVRTTPTADIDIANKKYVDDEIGSDHPHQDVKTTANPTFAGLISTNQIALNRNGANIITATHAGGNLRLGAGGGTDDLEIDTDGNIDIYGNLDVGGDFLTSGLVQAGTFINDAVKHNVIIGLNAADNLGAGAERLIAIGEDTAGASGAGLTLDDNIFIGYKAGEIATSATLNCGIGSYALSGLTTGDGNFALGALTLTRVTTLGGDVAIGYRAGQFNTGANNMAIGYQAMTGVDGSSTGGSNTAIGGTSLHRLTTGQRNIGIGDGAGTFISSGTDNTCLGRLSMLNSTTGGSNVAIGTETLRTLGTARYGNVGIGYKSGYSQNASNGIFIGRNAGYRQNLVNVFVLDSPGGTPRANVAAEQENALFYGVTAATAADQTLRINAGLQLQTATITASSDTTDVSGINTLFINPTNNTSIGGFTNGVVGQTLNVVITDDDKDITLQHDKAGAHQHIFIHAGADETLDHHYGGWVLVCDGSNWYGTAHERHS